MTEGIFGETTLKQNFKNSVRNTDKMMKTVAQAIAEMTQPQIIELEKNGSIGIEANGTTVTVDASDVEIRNEDIPGWLVANEGVLTVALDVTVSEELAVKGWHATGESNPEHT